MYLTQFFTIAIIHLLAVASPGPDFAVVTKNSLFHSRKIGIYTALGVACGIMVHVSYCLLGIGLVISRSIPLFDAIKYVGSAYLLYIGYKSLKAKPVAPLEDGQVSDLDSDRTDRTDRSDNSRMETKDKTILTPKKAVRSGFLTNVLNPKATLFFLAIFTQVIDPSTPKIIQAGYGLETMVITFVWFALVSLLFSNGRIKARITRIQHHIEHITGVVLIILGIKVALASRK